MVLIPPVTSSAPAAAGSEPHSQEYTTWQLPAFPGRPARPQSQQGRAEPGWSPLSQGFGPYPRLRLSAILALGELLAAEGGGMENVIYLSGLTEPEYK